MTQTPYIFNQLVQLIPRDKFDRIVKRHHGNAYVKGFSCWNHLLVLLWAQLTSRRSLRDIETSLRAHADKLYRLGMGRHISRNNINYKGSLYELSCLISVSFSVITIEMSSVMAKMGKKYIKDFKKSNFI